MSYLFTSEAVAQGHPDKICDQISDAILDAYLEQDKFARVACETTVCPGIVHIMGEITSTADVDEIAIAKEVLLDIGYNNDAAGFNLNELTFIRSIHKQSKDIAAGTSEQNLGAGDQGIMFGYATNESAYLMPLTLYYAQQIIRNIYKVPMLGPDGKCQVTAEYTNSGVFKRITTIVVSVQHLAQLNMDTIRHFVEVDMIQPVVGDLSGIEILINPTGRFVIGGPAADTGLTGRKIVVDTYGGACAHGGGAFSGKDPTKMDRSAAYIARHIAKHIVWATNASECEVQLAYCIGVAEPVSIRINSRNSLSPTVERELEKRVRKAYDLTPSGIINYLNLRDIKYRPFAEIGHIGTYPDAPWEIMDEDILKELTL